MRQKIPVSVIIFTLDEEVNLPRCLESVRDFDDVVVVDSFSQDATEAIARKSGARFVQHAFTGFGDQRNWALDHAVPKHEWVLILDADERVTPELADEIFRRVTSRPEQAGVAAFRLKRRFHLWGRWLRYSSLYPNWVVRLVHKKKVRFVNRGHAETQNIDGRLLPLNEDLIDENLKSLEDWRRRQERYAAKEAEYELESERAGAGVLDLFSREPLVRRQALKWCASRLPLRPFFYFLYAYFYRLGFLDGLEGFRFCRMKSWYQSRIVSEKIRLRGKA